MKRILGGVFALSLFVLASCGGTSEADIIGKWKVDASSIDIKLGDGVPAPIKSEVDEAMKDMKSEEGAKEVNNITLDFQEGGKLIVSGEGKEEKEEFKWSIDGDFLVIEGDMQGKKGKIKFNIDEVSGDKMTISLTGEDILAQIKEQAPEMIEGMKMMAGGTDIEKMAAGSKITVSLKK